MTIESVGPTDGIEPTIHCRDVGNGWPLLLLNGMAASGMMWPAAWLERLAASFRLLVVDNRGTGRSGWDGETFSIADLAADAISVLDYHGLVSAHVLGHSMGGMVAQALALDRPERVRSLVLCATMPGSSGVPTPPETLARLPGPNAGNADPELARNVWRVVTAPGFADRHPEVIAELAGQQAAQRTSRQVVMAQVHAARAFDSGPRLGAVRARTLVLHGEADPQVPVENGRIIAGAIPEAHLEVLSGVGHLVAYEDPARCARLIEDFVSAVEWQAAAM